MPKKPTIEHSILKASILKEEVVDEEGKVFTPKHPVWEKLAQVHDNKITDNYIYAFVKLNRHGIYTEILQAKGIEITAQEEERSDNTESDGQVDEDTEKAKKTQVQPECLFKVLITAEQWQKIRPKQVTYQRKERPNPRSIIQMPQYIWEPILIGCFWEQHKIPCAYSFRRATVFTSDTRECFIEIVASCHECGATGNGRILQEPLDNNPVQLEWRANDSRNVPHQKKRPLSHNLRQDVGKQLQGRSASAWRDLEASSKMQFGDVAPPHLFPQHVLRKAQQEHLDREYNIIQDSTDPIRNLQTWKHSQPYAGSIHQIGLDPFFVLYNTPAQLHIFKSFTRTEHVVLAIDATGSIVKKVSIASAAELKSSHIFLYEGVMKAGEQQLPVMQMLSSRQDASMIAFWIREFLRQGAPVPQEVVVDNSKALVNAVVVSFCGCASLKDYFSRCFYLLQNAEKIPEDEFFNIIPQSYLRLDLAHIVGGAAKWKEWKDKATKRLKTFYMHCLGLLILETTLDDFHKTFVTVGHVANSQFSDEDVSESVTALTKRIQGAESELSGLITMEDPESESEDDRELDSSSDGPDDASAELEEYIANIKAQIIRKSCEDDSAEPNAYYSTGVLKRFHTLLPDFLLWSALMAETFNSPTATGSSARVESDFSILKNSILGGKKRPMRLDKFISIHLKHVDGACHIAKAAMITDNNEDDGSEIYQTDSEDESNEDSHHVKKTSRTHRKRQRETDEESETEHEKSLNASDNWKGKAPTPKKLAPKKPTPPKPTPPKPTPPKPTPPKPSPKKPTSSKYLSPCPELGLVMEANALTPPKERLLKNGLQLGFSRTGQTSHAQLKNTCAFDVLTQITTSAYIQYGVYRHSVQKHLDLDLFKTCKSLAELGAVHETYQLRLTTLSKVVTPATVVPPKKATLRSRQSSVAITYDCFADLIDLSRELLKNAYSALVESKCSLRSGTSCSGTVECVVVNADVEVLATHSFKQLDKAVLLALNMMENSGEDCPVQNPRSTACQAEPCKGVASVKCTFGPHLFINVDIFASSTDLPQLQKNSVKINEVPTQLKIFDKKFVLCGIGARQSTHYVAYTRNAKGHWEIFNDLSKRVIGVQDTREVQPVLLMYVPINVT